MPNVPLEDRERRAEIATKIGGGPPSAQDMEARSRIVSASQMEEGLERVKTSVERPCHGIYGPSSISWEISRENVLFLGGGRAALLQIAHPFVAAAIEAHSRTFQDATGRFRRTFENVWAMTFGDLNQAFEAARRVHRIHASIRGAMPQRVGRYQRGQAYHANQAGALLWVYATLVDTSVLVFEQIVRPLSEPEKERFLAESKNFARLFGVPDALLPGGWRDFQAYMRQMLDSGAIVAEGPALRIAQTLFHPPNWWLKPVAAWYRAITAWLLPDSLREPFGFRLGAGPKASVWASKPVLKLCHRISPPPLRYVPAYRVSLRRVNDEKRLTDV